MSAVRKDAFAERLPDEVEIKNAEQLRTIFASQLKSEGREFRWRNQLVGLKLLRFRQLSQRPLWMFYDLFQPGADFV